mgnify:FL=1|jgi:hypothetical protein
MIIETKFNVGDKVFISKNGTFEESEVTEISIYIKDSIRIHYSIKNYFLRFFFEHELFKSKEELL